MSALVKSQHRVGGSKSGLRAGLWASAPQGTELPVFTEANGVSSAMTRSRCFCHPQNNQLMEKKAPPSTVTHCHVSSSSTTWHFETAVQFTLVIFCLQLPIFASWNCSCRSCHHRDRSTAANYHYLDELLRNVGFIIFIHPLPSWLCTLPVLEGSARAYGSSVATVLTIQLLCHPAFNLYL